MKVYIVTNVPFPNGMAPGNRIKCYAGALASAGVDCEIIVYRRTERYGVKPRNVDGRGSIYTVPFQYLSGSPLRRNNMLLRRIDDNLDKLRLMRFFHKNLKEGDVVLMYAGFDASFSVKVCKQIHRQGAYYVHELGELPYGTVKETPETMRMRRYVEKKLFPIVDGVWAISDALAEYALKYVSPKCFIDKIPILVDYEQYNIEDKSDESDVPYIFHSGTLTQQKDGILDMIEAFALASQQLSTPIKMICTGDSRKSSEAMRIAELINRYRLQGRLLFTGYLEEMELQEYLSKASVVIINKLCNQQNTYCFPTKLGEYMAAGKAIIITNYGEGCKWLTDEKNALVVEPGEVQALADAIVRLFSEPDKAKSLGVQASLTCKVEFDYRSNANRISTILRQYE